MGQNAAYSPPVTYLSHVGHACIMLTHDPIAHLRAPEGGEIEIVRFEVEQGGRKPEACGQLRDVHARVAHGNEAVGGVGDQSNEGVRCKDPVALDE